MFPTAKYTTPFWHSPKPTFEEKLSHSFVSYPKPQISDLVVLAVPFLIRDVLSSVSKGEYRYGMTQFQIQTFISTNKGATYEVQTIHHYPSAFPGDSDVINSQIKGVKMSFPYSQDGMY